MRERVEIMHGANLDQLGRRDKAHYGDLTLDALELKVEQFARDLGLVPRFFHSNHEGEFVEHLHRLEGISDAVILNPGAWTHYAWAIRDALELAAIPAVEIHLSDVERREEWRRVSVIRDVCIATVSGQGVDGYRDALARVKEALA